GGASPDDARAGPWRGAAAAAGRAGRGPPGGASSGRALHPLRVHGSAWIRFRRFRDAGACRSRRPLPGAPRADRIDDARLTLGPEQFSTASAIACAVAVPLPAPNDSSPTASAFGYRDFRYFFFSRVVTFLATQIQSVAIGWQVYEATHRPLDLGFVGLAQFLPAFGLSLTAGELADRFDRRRLLAMCGAAQLVVAAMLVVYS